jgi:flagella basal body P-ring formation protein FlgA
MIQRRLYPFSAPARRAAAVCAAALLLAAQGARAQPQWQDLDELRRAAESFAQAQLAALPGRAEVEVGALDPRTRLARCESLQSFLAPGARLWGNSNVGVRCVRPHAWSIFVPVNVRVSAEVLVTARPIGRGQTLAEADLVTQTVDLTRWPIGLLSDPAQALGRAPVAALPAGVPLRADMLRAAYVVTQGQRVKIVFQGEGFSATSEGRALGNAALGEPVQVRSASGKVLKGVVHAPGMVEVK